MSKKWWKYGGIRALKTFLQTLMATLATASVMDEVDWVLALASATCAGLLSLITSLGGLPEVKLEEELENYGESEI